MQKLALSSALAMCLSCSSELTSNLNSNNAEPPDQWNGGNQMNLAGEYFWNDLKEITEYKSPVFNHDLGVSFQSRELADRWGQENSMVASSFSQRPIMESQLKEYWESIAENGAKKDFLSPAEKYDFLLGGFAQTPDAETIKIVESNLEDYETNFQPYVDEVMAFAEAYQKQADAKQLEYRLVYGKIQKIAEELQLAQEAGNQVEVERLAAEKLAQEERLQTLNLEINDLQQQAFNERKKAGDSLKDYYRRSRQFAQTLKDQYPLFISGWDKFMYYSAEFRGDWSWFGLCHGQAGQTLYAPRTKHSVLAELDGREVFLFENDIRELQVKAWAGQRPTTGKYFVGRRCYHNDVENDASDRPIDGAICTQTSRQDCHLKDGGTAITIVDDRIGRTKTLRFRIGETGAELTGHITKNLRRDSYLMTYQNEAGEDTKVVVSIRKMCRDVNPMALHLALTQHVAQGRPIVVDGSRHVAVWNAPVGGFKLTYPVVKLKDGIDSTPGELLPVAAVDDPLAAHRADGTAYILPVIAQLSIRVDIGDGFNFREAGEQEGDDPMWGQRDYLTYTYTLEFDANQKLIGGEWGGYSIADNPVYNGMPDFIWLFPKAPQLVDGPINISILTQLEQCSRADEGVEEKNFTLRAWDGNGNSFFREKPIQFVRCPLHLKSSTKF